jgi:hypothetical protein
MAGTVRGDRTMRLDYSPLRARLAGMQPEFFAIFAAGELPQRLSDTWCQNYALGCPNNQIVTVDLDTFTYLFDMKQERSIAAYGVMGGKNSSVRDHRRMAGFPKSEGQNHRGHMIPHSGHGGTDINLFIQQGSVNIGPFRELEKLAVAHAGSFYFVHLIYSAGSSLQRPKFVEQGLFWNRPPMELETRFFGN